jgi:5-methylcytosine-specific restriction endonuclease McrA
MADAPRRHVPRGSTPTVDGRSERNRQERRHYGRRWANYSQQFLLLPANRWCRECERLGKKVRAAVTDHIQAHKGDERLFWDPGNHRPLCRSCNSKKAVASEGGFGRS